MFEVDVKNVMEDEHVDGQMEWLWFQVWKANYNFRSLPLPLL